MRIDDVEPFRIRIKQLEHQNKELASKAAKYDKARAAAEFMMNESIHAYKQAGWSESALYKLIPQWVKECLKN